MIWFQVFLLSLLISTITSKLIIETSFLMSHDAASGEIDQDRDGIVKAYTITQSVEIVGQLNCGARSLDYRPYCDNNIVIAHHGDIKIKKKMNETLAEIQTWLSTKKNNDIVVLYLSHYGGDSNCQSITESLLQSLGILSITNCEDLKSLTVQDVIDKGKLVAVRDCMVEQYDSSINCYTMDSTCYGINSDKTMKQLYKYVNESTYVIPKEAINSNMWMTQVHWQSDALSVSIGTLHNSDILRDESKSGVNKWLLNQINTNKLNYLNHVEVDNVCDYGLDIYNALQIKYK